MYQSKIAVYIGLHKHAEIQIIISKQTLEYINSQLTRISELKEWLRYSFFKSAGHFPVTDMPFYDPLTAFIQVFL